MFKHLPFKQTDDMITIKIATKDHYRSSQGANRDKKTAVLQLILHC